MSETIFNRSKQMNNAIGTRGGKSTVIPSSTKECTFSANHALF